MKTKPDPSLKLCNQTQLEALLYEVGLRLGTSDEQPGDMERARAIAHQLNNLLTSLGLLGEVAKFPRSKTKTISIRPSGKIEA
jgi:hypothetical protein